MACEDAAYSGTVIALVDSGLGLLPSAAWLRTLRPDLDLMLHLDPDGAPWGPRPQHWVADRVLAVSRHAVQLGADVIVLGCNTASVAALELVRAEVGQQVPVVGTVPAIKPAAAAHGCLAVWATAATTASAYQADLIRRFGAGAQVVSVACHGLAEAIDRGDVPAIEAAIAQAAAATPPGTEAVVLGCTHYPLVRVAIAAALPAEVQLFDSAEAVAAQTLRRLAELGPQVGGSGTVAVFNSGRAGSLPASAAVFAAGRLLLAAADRASTVAAAGCQPPGDLIADE